MDSANNDNSTPSDPAWYVETQSQAQIGRNVVLAGPNVINYTDKLYGPLVPLLHATNVVRQGHRISGTPDECDFKGYMRISGPTQISINELAYDPSRCLLLVQVGLSSDPDPLGTTPLANSIGDATGTNEKIAGQAGVVGARPSSAGVSVNFRAKTRSQVREPLYGALPATSEVNVFVDIRNGEPRYAPTRAGASWSWLRASGWSLQSTGGSYDFNYNYARATRSAHFKNNIAGKILCKWPFGSTYADHDPTEVRAHWNGYAQYSTHTTKHGTCSALLRTNQSNYFWWL